MRRLKITTDATVEPLTAALIKSHLRIDGSTEDTYLTQLAKAVRVAVENHTGRVLAPKALTQTMDCFPFDLMPEWDGVMEGSIAAYAPRWLELLAFPLVAVQSVTAYDVANGANVMSAGDYFVDAASPDSRGRVVLNIGAVWPAIVLRPANGVVIAFTAGYGDGTTGPLLPPDLLQAMLMVAGELYENRGDLAEDAVTTSGADRLLARYAVIDL